MKNLSTVTKMTSTTLLCCFSLVAHSGAEQNSQQNHNKVASDVENIEVHGVRRRLNDSGALKDNIVKTELLTDEYIKNSQASSLADAIKNAVGIRVSNECSMCGAKRVMINGMKGEHTNVLIDGIPMHTMISGFYGMDSVAATGIGSRDPAGLLRRRVRRQPLRLQPPRSSHSVLSR